jgi:hypothetical protein
MAKFDELPHTYQGLKDYIAYAKKGVAEADKRIKNLNEGIAICQSRLEKLAEKTTTASSGMNSSPSTSSTT